MVIMKLFVCLVCIIITWTSAQNVLELMDNIEELSEFLKLMESNRPTKALLKENAATVFAPNNNAMRMLKEISDADTYLVDYHVVNQDYTTEALIEKKEISTHYSGNTPLYITVEESGQYRKTIYVNNAKITRDDQRGETFKGNVQVLHIIDRVLIPVKRKPNANVDANPRALDLMKGGTSYVLSNNNFDLTKFAQAVASSRSQHLFNGETASTFFIPVRPDLMSARNFRDSIDERVAGAHVIPGKVLFTRTLNRHRPYHQTASMNDELKIFISMTEIELANKSTVWLAESLTKQDDRYNKLGLVSRRILKANIPLDNGVAHFIDKPLAVIDQSLGTFLNSEKDLRLKAFNDLLNDFARDFKDSIVDSEDVTLLAPSNKAFNYLDADEWRELQTNPQKRETILNLHLLNQRRLSFTAEPDTIAQENTKFDNKKVYFRVATKQSGRRVLTVDGGGVNASVSHADIATTGGIVHIIDRVLGIPYMTVAHKLESDPELSLSNELGIEKGFNEKMRVKESLFTYFVPNNKAWAKIDRTFPSSYKKLFVREKFVYQAHQILNRHLLLNGSYSMETLMRMMDKNGSIKTLRGDFLIRIKGNGEYQVRWNGLTANVVRPDVKCTNGMIHVLDNVLMKADDVTVSVAASLGTSIATTLLLLCAVKYLL